MSSGPVVLAVDDEPQIVRAMRVYLRSEGFEVLSASTASEALDIAVTSRPDAYLLDLMLPDGDGLDLTRKLRAWTRAPILVVSAYGDEQSVVSALDAGADDFIAKPFSPGQLAARLRACLRRATSVTPDVTLQDGELSVDLAQRLASLNGTELSLTPTEFGLLATLLHHRGKILTHRVLLLEVWGSSHADDIATLRTHLTNLRRKLGPAATRLRTELGIGYRWVSPS